LWLALVASSDALAAYVANDFVSDIPGAARRTDANLVNPWGVAVGTRKSKALAYRNYFLDYGCFQ